MPFLSFRTLEGWLREFEGLGYPHGASLKVVHQDGANGADTGLVSVSLTGASTDTYIQPETVGSRKWFVTFEPRDASLMLDPAGVLHLSSELATVSALCAFLQAKSADFSGDDEA
ncbi:hypothetical protein [Agromyces silvae]|uniref:hypothetical protein n=1 Tax=Agromyces silvae TaxID=3388266 RepID=UPI00280B5120|nr:hypothetical protein [Agromyces protaetiae]